MKKNVIYGVITVCIAAVLMVGAILSAPEDGNDPASTAGSAAATTVTTSEPTAETTVPTQTQQPSQTELIVPPETRPSETQTQPTEPVPTDDRVSGIRFVTWPETIAGGETGTVTIQGQPNTTYSIKVYYKSGPSGAKGLEDKVSDADGFVTWTWKVSKNTKPGDFKIVVSGGGETMEVPFTVLD